MRAPVGVAPRRLPSDDFEKHVVGDRAITSQHRDAVQDNTAASHAESQEEGQEEPAEGDPAPPPPRDWAFGIPDPAPPRPEEALLDPDTNWRQHAGLRAPAVPVPLPVAARERFSENWERLAAEPRQERSGPARRGLGRFRLTRWLVSGGRADAGLVTGMVLLAALLAAAFIYGWRVVTTGETKASPASGTTGEAGR